MNKEALKPELARSEFASKIRDKFATECTMLDHHHGYLKVNGTPMRIIKWIESNIITPLESENAALKAELDKHRWIPVGERLPENFKFNMSKDVYVIAGSKQLVSSYDYELKRWNTSPYITVTHWQSLIPPEERKGE